jgi:integrase
MLKALALLALDFTLSGCAKELVSLTMDDVTLSERKEAIQVRAEVAKGGKEREVPVPKNAREALQIYIEDHPAVSDGTMFMG